MSALTQSFRRRYSLSASFVRCVAALAFAMAPASTSAQQRDSHVSGRVQSSTGEPVAGATVEVVGTLIVTRADSLGRFTLMPPEKQLTLRARRIGFHSLAINVLTDTLVGRTLTITLAPAPAAFQQVLIVGRDREGSGQGAGVELTRESARRMPPLGEPDLLRALPFVPHVLQPDDLSNRFHVAGGAGDELLITLDEHPMQSSTHASGALSSFNLAAVERASLSVHDVRAGVDSRLGGVLAITTRDATRPQREGVVSLISASATVAEPLLDGRATLLLSARRTYLDAVLPRIVRRPTTDPGLVPTFSDALVRLRIALGAGWNADLLGLRASDDRATSVNAIFSPFTSSEDILGLRIARETGRWQVQGRVSHSRHSASQQTRPVGAPLYDVSRRWLDSRIVARYTVSPKLRVTAGAGSSARAHRYGWTFSNRFNAFLPLTFSGEENQQLGNGSLELETSSAQWELVAGARVAVHEGGTHPAPRLLLKRRLGGSSSLSVAADRRVQFDTEMGPPLAGQPEQPTFLLTRPRTMDGVALILESSQRAGRVSLESTVSVFTRRFIGRTQPINLASNNQSATEIAFSRRDGRAEGGAIAVTARTAQGAVLQGSYAYGNTVEREATGRLVRSDWDVPHTLTAILGVPLGQKLVLSGSLQLHSGLPLTPLASRVLVPGLSPGDSYFPRPVLGVRNSGRTPAFSRLDVGIRRTWSPGRVEMVGTLQITNLIGSRNPLELDLRQYIATPGNLEAATRRQGLPRVPSIGLEIRW